jgi:hypothetical protein
VVDDSDPRRDKTREFFQGLGPADPEKEGSVLTGWVVVQEWMDPAGEKTLTRAWDHTLAEWAAKGMMHEVLFGSWPAGEADKGA